MTFFEPSQTNDGVLRDAPDWQWNAELWRRLEPYLPLDEDWCPLTELLEIHEALVEATTHHPHNTTEAGIALYEESVQPGTNSVLAHLDCIEGAADEGALLHGMVKYREAMASLRASMQSIRQALVAEIEFKERPR